MGCHTWFSRPVTEGELSVFKSHAIEDAYNLWGDTEENKQFKLEDEEIIEEFRKNNIE